MVKKFTLEDFKFGNMNELIGSLQRANSLLSLRRTSVVRTMNQNLQKTYTSDLIEGKTRWNAVVMRSHGPNKHAYVYAPFQRFFSTMVEGTKVYYTYKIYITELDAAMRIPSDYEKNYAFLNSLRTAIPEVGNPLGLGFIDPLTAVEVIFQDQERLRNPMIVNVHGAKKVLIRSKTSDRESTAGKRRTTVNQHTRPPEEAALCPDALECSPGTPSDPNWLRCPPGGEDNDDTSYPQALALGASYVHNRWTFAGEVHGLNIQRVAKAGRQLWATPGGDGKLTVGDHLQAYVSGGCLDLREFNRFIIFAGANAISSGTAISQLKNLLAYLKEQNPDAKTIVVTLHGWGDYVTDSENGWHADDDMRERIMEKTVAYNNWIRSDPKVDNAPPYSGVHLIDYVVDWEAIGTMGGSIVPGNINHDRLKNEYSQAPTDGLHPNSTGHIKIAEMIQPYLIEE